MSCASKFVSYVTMISFIDLFLSRDNDLFQLRDNDLFHFFIDNKLFTNPANAAWLKLFFFFFAHNQIFVKVFFQCFFTVFKLFNNFFNKFISSIFTTKNSYWLRKFLINTNKLVTKTTRNVILIFFWVEPFITLKTL